MKKAIAVTSCQSYSCWSGKICGTNQIQARTEDEQDNRNCSEIYTFLYQYRAGAAFAWNTACILPAIDLHKFTVVSSRILYRSSWVISSNCLRGSGGRNLLILLSKTDHSGSMIFKYADCVKVHLHAPQTKTEHFWLRVWANFHLEKLHHC
jgi:hypothetical protein